MVPKFQPPTYAEFDLEQQFPQFKGWEALGFQRSLAKELYEIVIELVKNVLFIFILVWLIPIIQPYPEIIGYNNLAGGLFATVYIIFDTGTNFGIYRFIAEYRIKDVNRMMQYISFYIKYQMLTGLVQVTVLSYYTFMTIRTGSYAYLSWMLLLILQKQWPGMAGIFKTVLSGFQHHSKVALMSFLQGQVVEKITMLGLILIGRRWGENNPEIGLIMGICIFTHIGNYLDDIIFGFISAYWTNKILKEYMGVTLLDVWQVRVRKPVLKEMLFYGVQGSLLPILSSFVATFTLIAYSTEITNYITWISLITWGARFSNIAKDYGDFSISTLVAESYSNGKKKLAEFYFTYSVRWRFLFILLVFMTLLAIYPFYEDLITKTDVLSGYQGANQFFIPLMFAKLITPFIGYPGAIMVGAEKITTHNIIRAVEEVVKLFFIQLFLYWIRIQDIGGIWVIVFLLGYQHIIPMTIKTAFCFWYINKKIMKTPIYWRATFVGPIIASLPVLAFAQLGYNYMFLPLSEVVGIIASMSIMMVVLLVVVVFIYLPLNVLIGGWDDYMFYTFKKGVELSGPSKILFMPVYRLMERVKIFAIKLKRYDKPGWVIPYSLAHQQLRELMEIKNDHRNQSEK